jgi:C1A family cysteine protease
MQERVYDAQKDLPDQRDHLAAPAANILPSNISLRPWLGPVKNQGQLGSCTAHAGTGLREYLYRKLYQYEAFTPVLAKDFRLSPLFLYAIEREMEGDFTQDEGAQSRTIYQSLAASGCCLESLDPYAEGNLLIKPTPEQLAEGFNFRHIAYHRALTLDILKSVLASGYAATVGMPVFQSFESDETAQTGIVTVPTSSDTPIGGHEMLVCGYSDAKKALDVRNSWGDDWGEGGNCWIPYAYFEGTLMEQVDFWTAHLGKPWV